MFTSQIHNKPLSDEEKYGYLLELVAPKVRSRLANLKPGALGYKTAWDRLKTEFGQSKTVVAANMEEIINFPVTIGSSYERVRELYEKLSRNFDALQTLGRDGCSRFCSFNLKQGPQSETRSSEGWEDCNMEKLIDSIKKWLKRYKAKDNYKDQTDTRREERNYFSQKAPHCLFCNQTYWGDS